MGTPPDRLPQSVEELRGDLLQHGRTVITPGVAAGTAKAFALLLDGRPTGVVAASYAGSGTRGDTGGFIRRLQALTTSAITGVATNNVTLNVRRMLNNVAVATIYTVTFGVGTSWAAGVVNDLTTAVNTQLQPGEYIDVQVVQNAAGMAIPDITWTFEYTRLGV